MPVKTATIDSVPTIDLQKTILKNVASYIEKTGLQPGQRLPSERELMQGLGVGRSTLREAISHLTALGVIEVRRGSGTFLTQLISPTTLYLPLVIDSNTNALLRTLDIRRALETEASALAALRATPEQLSVMEDYLDEMERIHLSEGAAGDADLLFHQSIYDASGNPLFRQLLSQIRESFESFWKMEHDHPDFGKQSFPLHRELFNTIAAHDPCAARAKALELLRSVELDITLMYPEH